MSRDKTKIYCFFAASLILMLFGAVSVFAAFGSEFDADIGHFARDSVFGPIVYGCFAGGAVCAVAAWILFAHHRAADDGVTVGKMTVLHTVLCSLAAVVMFADAVADIVEYYFSITSYDTGSGAMHYVLWALGLVGGACMLVCALPAKYNAPQRALAGFAPPLFMAVKVLVLYFDGSVAVNSPAKLAVQLALIGLMLSLCAEAGVTVGRAHIFPRWIATLCLSSVIGGAVGMGMLLIIATGGKFNGSNIFDALLLSVFAVRSIVKLFGISKEELRYENKKDSAGEI